MARRRFAREFKLQAVRLVRDLTLSIAQAARVLDLHENLLHNGVRQSEAWPGTQLAITTIWPGIRSPCSKHPYKLCDRACA
jgi:transposase